MPKKLSKKARKKLEEQKKKEEEERLERERLEAIAAEKAAIEAEKKRVAQEKFDAEEKLRLEEQYKEIEPCIQDLNIALTKQEATYEKEREWERYQLKGDNGIPYNNREIAALYTRYKDMEIEDKDLIKEYFNSIQEVEDLCHELKVMELKAKVSGNIKGELWFKDYIKKFRTLTLKHIKLITAKIANKSNTYIEDLEKEKLEETGKGHSSNKKQKIICFPKKDVKLGVLICSEEKAATHPKMEFEEIQAQAGIPRNLPNGHFLLRLFWSSYDYLSQEESTDNIIVLGGIFDVTIYNSLPPPKEFKDWKIKPYKEKEDALDVIPFPKPDADNNIVVGSKLLIGFKLPKRLYIGPNDERQVVQWVPEKQKWSSEYVDETDLKPDKMLEITTVRLCPAAFFQARTIDFPYKSWKLRAIGENLALLDLEGKRLTLRFEISSGFVRLRKMPEEELSHIIEKDMEPAQLLYELYRCGINLLPEDKDQQNCLKILKDPLAEDKAIEDICSAINSYYFKSTRWNAQSPKEFVLARFIKNMEYDQEINEDFDYDWKTAAWYNNKATLMKVREHHNEENFEREDNILTHANFFLLLKNESLTSNPEVLNRFKEFRKKKDPLYHDVMFYSTLKKLMKLLRILTFSS